MCALAGGAAVMGALLGVEEFRRAEHRDDNLALDVEAFVIVAAVILGDEAIADEDERRLDDAFRRFRGGADEIVDRRRNVLRRAGAGKGERPAVR